MIHGHKVCPYEVVAELRAKALEVFLRHDDALSSEAFAAFGDLCEETVGANSVALAIQERGHARVVVSTERPAEGSGELARIPSSIHVLREVYQRGVPYVPDGAPVAEHAASSAPVLGGARARSVIVHPVRDSRGRVFADMTLGFPTHDGAATADRDVLGALSDALGLGLVHTITAARHRRWATLLERSGGAIFGWDADGRIADVGGSAAALVGFGEDDLIGQAIEEVFGRIPPSFARAQRLRLKRPGRGEIQVVGVVVPVERDPFVVTQALVFDGSVAVSALRASAHPDVARALMADPGADDVSDSGTALPPSFDRAPVLLFHLAPETGRVVRINRYVETLFGITVEDALARTDFIRDVHVGPEARTAFDEALVLARLGASADPYEALVRTKAGEARLARVTVHPLLSPLGRVGGIEGTLIDVQEERAERGRVAHTDRDATLGILAAGVASELGGSATFLQLGLDNLARSIEAATANRPSALANAARQVGELSQAATRLGEVVRSLRLFAGLPTLADEPCGEPAIVSRAVDAAMMLARVQLQPWADVEIDLREAPQTRLDERKLSQVLLALLLNAAQAEAERIGGAGGERGRVRISARWLGALVEIVVEDTGIGIHAEQLPLLFEPFFSGWSKADTPPTEPVTPHGRSAKHLFVRGDAANGTGLGLAIARSIVETVGGHVRAESPSTLVDPPRGARLVVTLPVATEELPEWPRSPGSDAPPNGGPPSGTPAPGRAHVLFVARDDGLTRALAENIASSHEVTLTSTVEEALWFLGQRVFEVILCDIGLPDAGAERLFDGAILRDPKLSERFVFMGEAGARSDLLKIVDRAHAPVFDRASSPSGALMAIATVAGRHSTRVSPQAHEP